MPKIQVGNGPILDTELPLEKRTLSYYENGANYIGIYAFYDIKAKRYDIPFNCKTDLNAKRHFIMSLEREGTIINKFQDEFAVHRLGFLDLIQGEYVPFETYLLFGKNIAKKE